MSASTAIITDLNTVYTTAPTAASNTKANSATGPIQDLVGNFEIALLKAKELKYLLQQISNGIDSGDPDYTTIQNVLLTLV